jgi:hypothetical protein
MISACVFRVISVRSLLETSGKLWTRIELAIISRMMLQQQRRYNFNAGAKQMPCMKRSLSLSVELNFEVI